MERSVHNCRCDNIVAVVNVYNCIYSPDGEAIYAPSSGDFNLFAYYKIRFL